MMKEQPLEQAGTPGPSQLDVDTWRILKKALRTGLSDRGLDVGNDEASLMTRFMLEQIEKSGLRVVPLKPTSEMHEAIKMALNQGKRMSVAWVRGRTKQFWRWKAAVDAAPNWRRGYAQDLVAKGDPRPEPELSSGQI
ncbi:hypothetical protein [Rhizobium sp. 18065]|uniref:hypothetical protein n=1 Tax=Rhizobium sp. 18065 TaxID=2681411 RepID=UPI00135A0063|nr:hypothetical protein [Rhizobium sp. 18065]